MKLGRHKDERGEIIDLMVGKDFSVTYITFKKGAVRGNHYHKKTKQIDIVLDGRLKFVNHYKLSGILQYITKGTIKINHPMTSHAYKAMEDSSIISVCIGKRVGNNYEKDTFRLKEPLL